MNIFEITNILCGKVCILHKEEEMMSERIEELVYEIASERADVSGKLNPADFGN